MLSVVVFPAGDPQALVLTLSVLVEGAVEGVVREVLVVDTGLDAASHELADQAGCVVVNNIPVDIVAQARGDWLLVLEAGAVPGEGWVRAVSHHMAASHAKASFRYEHWWNNVLPRFLTRPLALGLLVMRSDASKKPNFHRLARRAKKRLAARIAMNR